MATSFLSLLLSTSFLRLLLTTSYVKTGASAHLFKLPLATTSFNISTARKSSLEVVSKNSNTTNRMRKMLYYYLSRKDDFVL